MSASYLEVTFMLKSGKLTSHHLPDQMRSQWLIVTRSARCLLSRYNSAAQLHQQWKEAAVQHLTLLPVSDAHCGDNPTFAHRCLDA